MRVWWLTELSLNLGDVFPSAPECLRDSLLSLRYKCIEDIHQGVVVVENLLHLLVRNAVFVVFASVILYVFAI